MTTHKYSPVDIHRAIIGLEILATHIEVTEDLDLMCPIKRGNWQDATENAAEIIRQEHEHVRSLYSLCSEMMRQRAAEKEARLQLQERFDELQKRFDSFLTNFG